MTRKGRGIGRRTRRALGRVVGAGLCAASIASPALAQICDLAVHDAYRGEVLGTSDLNLETNDQFIACFTPAADGYVSLWAQWDGGSPLVRLTPGESYRGPGERAAPVWSGLETCFGTGSDGYFLSAPATDGASEGLLLLAFTPSEDAQPAEAAGVSAGAFGDAAGGGCAATLGARLTLAPRSE